MTVIDEHSLLTKELDAAIAAKNWAALPAIESRIDELQTKATNSAANTRMMAMLGDGGSALPGGRQLQSPESFGLAAGRPPVRGIPTTKGWQVNPLSFDDVAADRIVKSIETGTPVHIKSFNTVESLLPAELAPGVTERVHEGRFLDWQPTMPMSGPQIEFIVDSTSSNTVTAPTAEGSTKPSVVLNLVEKTATAIKLAALFSTSWESQMDRPTLLGYLQQEVTRQIQDLENAQFISGSGTGGNMLGLLNTPGILSSAVPGTLPDGQTYIDYVQRAITQMRVGAALGVVDQLWVNPTTWCALKELKDSLGRYLIQPSPASDAPDMILGVRVHQTTAMAAGTALMLDSTKWGYCLVRQGITLQSGYNATDFAQNLVSYAIETRESIACTRPAAVLALTGLPTTD